MKIQYLFCLALIGFLSNSCSEDEKAIVPGFLTINDISVNATPQQGTSDDNIRDATVFVNDVSAGTFELPATIPILTTNEPFNLKIRGGIFRNGQSNDRQDYPFYTTYEVDTIFSPEEEITINPEVEYFSTAVINDPWSGEDFEGGINFEYGSTSDTTFVRIQNTPDNFEGASGLAHLVSGQTFFEARSPTFFEVNRIGIETFVEFNYKSTHTVEVLIFANGQSVRTPLVFLRPRDTYSKIYIPLTDVFSTFSSAINFNFGIAFSKPIEGEGKLFVDNFKMVRF